MGRRALPGHRSPRRIDDPRPGAIRIRARFGDDDPILLYVDHAEWIATAATPSHKKWAEALCLGMNELHVCLRAKARLDRLQLRHHIIKRVHPILNILEAEVGGSSPFPLRATRTSASR